MDNIILIRTDRLHPHPENPRKDLGDISELADSISKHGIMQNLTVAPIKEAPGEYKVIIGHRRLAAAQAAGLEEVPCAIRELSPEQQFMVMMEENMQRSDLTVPEQAYGFQLMFKWGNSVEDIARKTGFSETTVRHRLEIAKLDKKTLLKRQQDSGDYMQLGINDLLKLEKVKDIKKRNEILGAAKDSSDLQNRINNHLNEMKKIENRKKLTKLLRANGIEEAPDSIKNSRWSNKYDRPAGWYLSDDDCLEKAEKDIKKFEKGRKYYYIDEYSSVNIYTAAKKEKKEESEYDRIQKKGKQLHKLIKDAEKLRTELVRNAVTGKLRELSYNETVLVIRTCWTQIRNDWNGYYNSAASVLYDQRYGWYSLTDEQKQAAEDLEMWKALLIMTEYSMTCKELFSYPLKFKQDVADRLREFTNLLNRLYGFEWPVEYASLFDGTHELYEKDGKDGKKV